MHGVCLQWRLQWKLKYTEKEGKGRQSEGAPGGRFSYAVRIERIVRRLLETLEFLHREVGVFQNLRQHPRTDGLTVVKGKEHCPAIRMPEEAVTAFRSHRWEAGSFEDSKKSPSFDLAQRTQSKLLCGYGWWPVAPAWVVHGRLRSALQERIQAPCGHA